MERKKRTFMKKFKIFLQNIKMRILAITLIVILIEIIFFAKINDLTILITTALLIIGIRLNRLNEIVLIGIGLVLIIFCPVLLAFKQIFIAERVAIWAYIFLLLGVVKRIIISLRQNG